MDKYVVHDVGVCCECGERCASCEDKNTNYDLLRTAKLRIDCPLPKDHRPVPHKCDDCGDVDVGVFGCGVHFRCLDCWVQAFTKKEEWLWCVYCGGTCKDNPEVSGTCICNSCGKKSLQHSRVSYSGLTMDAKLCECCGSAWNAVAKFHTCTTCSCSVGACCAISVHCRVCWANGQAIAS